MNFKEVEKLIDIFSKNSISSIFLKEGDFEIHLEKNTSLPQVSPTPAIQVAQNTPVASSTPAPMIQESLNVSEQSGTFIESPMVGTFYRCPAPNASPYVNVGDKIKKGQIIGIIEAMKIMNEIEADFDCRVVEIIANDAQPVEFGTHLIKVEKI
ncbi:acetyl-CoA carboxylase biotin carboxyl carrier protein [Helicobacter cholecystus]|uniref:Biotin carboxyl carrier protein of acetyl-CoA carboxylase n=1 Tax=Helicobacter cholecystus TaxID=45498 RepID=A0A3D8ISD5_9HELI|nr:acetyl-CoA carboxylase biotin carboxyl carrier protein [Helicobacter cholecystus]RDU68197.1 acetyl-CoA carboxylase biotin carboxyl carrier protein [Helicobacter cholecystus]VEJ26083.1 biotin carboxyl carrier protein [Helicobacter cholecystus]